MFSESSGSIRSADEDSDSVGVQPPFPVARSHPFPRPSSLRSFHFLVKSCHMSMLGFQGWGVSGVALRPFMA